jgi:hypothetical protein
LLGGDGIGERVDAPDGDRARIRPQQPNDHAQGRRLAGAVRTDQGIELAAIDGEIERVDRRTVKAFADAAKRKCDGTILFHSDRSRAGKTAALYRGVVSAA